MWCKHLCCTHHILFECINVETYRNEIWNNIDIPVSFKMSMEEMNNYDKTCFILNAFYVKYTCEWRTIYDSLSMFVYELTRIYDLECSNQ